MSSYRIVQQNSYLPLKDTRSGFQLKIVTNDSLKKEQPVTKFLACDLTRTGEQAQPSILLPAPRSITWEVIRKAPRRLPPAPSDSEELGAGPGIWVNKPAGASAAHSCLRTCFSLCSQGEGALC